jgi:PST family polysaccharide transporter
MVSRLAVNAERSSPSAVSPATLRTLAAVGALQLAVILVLLVRTKLLAVWLGPEPIGILAVVDRLLAVFAQTAGFSLPFAALRFLSPLWASDRPGHDRLYRRLRLALVVACGCAAASGTAIAWWAPGAFGGELDSGRALLLAAFATVPVLGFVPFLQNALASRAAPRAAMLFLLAHAVVFTVASLTGAWRWGLEGLYLAYALAGLPLVAGFAFGLGGRRSSPGAPRAAGTDRFGLPGAVWRFGTILSALAFAAPFAALYAAYRLLASHGAEAAGWMQAAFAIGLAVRTVLGAANQVYLTPGVNREAPAAERGRWMAEYLRKLSIVVALVVPPLVLAPDLLVKLLYTDAFSPAAQFVALFVLAEVITVLGGVPQAMLVALDRLGPHVALNVVAQLLLAALAYALVPAWGVAGVGAAMLAAAGWLLVTPALYLRSRLALSIPPADLVLVGYVVTCVALCGALGAAGGTGARRALAATAADLATLGGLALLLRREERAELRRALSALGRALRRGPTG